MSPPFWVVTAVVVFVVIGLVQFGVRKLIERAGRRVDSASAPNPDSWAVMIVERHRAQGNRFDFDLIFLGWRILLGGGLGLAALIDGWGLGWGIFCVLFGAFSAAAMLTRIKYGTTKPRDLQRLFKRQPRRQPPLTRND